MSKIINDVLRILQGEQVNEELTPKEEKDADKMVSKVYNREAYLHSFISQHAAPDTYSKFRYDDKGSGKKIIRIPVTLENTRGEPSSPVHDFLKQHGYRIKDKQSYIQGLAHKEIQTGNPDKGIPYSTKTQSYRIGAVLDKHKAPEHVQHAFKHDPLRVSGKNNEYDLIVTNHPHDVYGMSTGRSWTSCASLRKTDRLNNGIAAQKMDKELKHHTHVVYLVKRDGNHDTDAVARVLFKKHTALNELSDGGRSYHQTLISENTVYGDAPQDFNNVAKHEMAKLFPIKNDIYVKNDEVHNDNGRVIHNNLGTSVPNEKLDEAWKKIGKENKSILYQHVNPDGKYQSKKLKEVQKAIVDIRSKPSGDFMEDVGRVRNAFEYLDKDQQHHGIRSNPLMQADDPAIKANIESISKSFNPDNEDHRWRLSNMGVDHPMRSMIYRKIDEGVSNVKTVEDFGRALKIHKVLGNRDYEKIHVAHDHELGDDPIGKISHSGILKDHDDYRKTYSTFFNTTHARSGDNFYGIIHRLAEEGAPNSDNALHHVTQDLIEKSKSPSNSYGTSIYAKMNPHARRYYADQLGHTDQDVEQSIKDHHEKYGKKD